MGPSPAPGAPLRQAKTLRTFSGQEQPGGSLRGREGGLIDQKNKTKQNPPCSPASQVLLPWDRVGRRKGSVLLMGARKQWGF